MAVSKPVSATTIAVILVILTASPELEAGCYSTLLWHMKIPIAGMQSVRKGTPKLGLCADSWKRASFRTDSDQTCVAVMKQR